jgi:tetratricopeptide (TPR) repeat protein
VALPSGKAVSLEGQSAVEVRHRIAGCERETLGAANRALRGDLERVIAKALRLKMSDRYADASELAGDFRRLLSYEPVGARPGTRPYRSRMFLRRNWLAATATAAVFLAIVAAAVVFRVDEARVKAALNVATERGQEIARQNAAGHARTALLAEQRGNWAEAAKEYQAAEAGHFPDRLALAVGELRALSRLEERRADADALVTRVHKTMPDIAQSPQFQVVEGFFYWATKPDESVKTIRTALIHADQLPPADRAFAAALLTDDIKTVAKKLRESVEADPFNRDAWGLLALCDLALGEVQKCEQDAGVMQRLYPGDGVGTVLAAIAAAFEGRRSAAIGYLDGDANVPPQLNETLVEAVDVITQIHSVDDFGASSPLAGLKLMNSISASAALLSSSHTFPVPLTFSRFTKSLIPTNLLESIRNPDSVLEMIASWPNGDGEFAAGLLALDHRDDGLAAQHLRGALASPCLIDCRRRAAFALTYADYADYRIRHVPTAEGLPVIKADLERLISSGGIYPERHGDELMAISVAISYDLYPQVRTLASTWFSRVPDDPRATYFLALAESNLDGRDTALALYRRALVKGLTGDLKTDAEAQIKRLNENAATKPATRP